MSRAKRKDSPKVKHLIRERSELANVVSRALARDNRRLLSEITEGYANELSRAKRQDSPKVKHLNCERSELANEVSRAKRDNNRRLLCE